jgi:hypothetical protein
MLSSFRIWHEGEDVSDILGFCDAWGVTKSFWGAKLTFTFSKSNKTQVSKQE